jgi:hypothetical protein
MQALDALLPSNTNERRTLAELIFAKIEDAEANAGTAVIKPSGYPKGSHAANLSKILVRY